MYFLCYCLPPITDFKLMQLNTGAHLVALFLSSRNTNRSDGWVAALWAMGLLSLSSSKRNFSFFTYYGLKLHLWYCVSHWKWAVNSPKESVIQMREWNRTFSTVELLWCLAENVSWDHVDVRHNLCFVILIWVEKSPCRCRCLRGSFPGFVPAGWRFPSLISFYFFNDPVNLALQILDCNKRSIPSVSLHLYSCVGLHSQPL